MIRLRDLYEVFDMGHGMKAMRVRLNFDRGKVSETAGAVHIFDAAFAEWYPGVPESFRIRYSKKCAGRQTYTPVPTPRRKVTCVLCLRWEEREKRRAEQRS